MAKGKNNGFELSPVMQLGVIMIVLAAIALVAIAYKAW